MSSRHEKEQAALAELRAACPKVQVEAWYDNTGGPGTGKWKIRGIKNGAAVVVIAVEAQTRAISDFRAAYDRANNGGLL